MALELRRTGIGVVGDKPWGTHFCYFYDTKEDLLDMLVPYFKAGLEDNEFCVWVVSEPLTERETWNALGDAVPELDRYVSDRSIEIFLGRDWCLNGATFDLKRVTNAWNEKLKEALARGYAGMRVSGNTAWLEKKDWKEFSEYERELNDTITGQRMTVLCTYPLAASAASQLLDVVNTHQFAITKREGAWEIIETPELKQAKAEIKKLDKELEQRVVERTKQLEAANVKLSDEIEARKRAEDLLRERETLMHAVLDNSPTLIFLKDKEGRYLLVNKEFERAFHVSQEEIKGKTDEEVFPAEQAAVFRSNDLRVLQADIAMEFEEVALQGDGLHTSIVHKFPLFDGEGRAYATGGIVTDISQRKRMETESLALKDELAAELTAMTKLHEFSTRLLASIELPALLEEVLNATIALQNADFGNVQLYNHETRALEIIAHRGFQKDFLDHFSSVSETGAACGRAMQRRDRVIIEDVQTDPEFEPHRQIAASAGFRAEQSTPLFSRGSELLGMISTHFREPHRPSEHELQLTDLYARQAAEMIERKRAEEKLRQSEEHFRLLVEQVEDYAIFSLNPEGRVSSWNAGAERINGYRAHEIIGQHISRFYPREDVERGMPEMGLRAAAAEGRFEYEGWRIRKDGSRLWANVVITALRDHEGKLAGFSKITRDVTERKRTEEALRESEKQLRLAQDASGSGVWDWNPLTDTATWSDEHFRIFGLEPTGRKFPWSAFLAVVHPDDIARFESAVREALKLNGELEVEYRIQRPDGEFRWLMSKGQTHCDIAGRPIRMIGLTTDITERKRLEQALLKTQTELAHLSRIMTLGELTGSIAHEVNQPLGAIVTDGDGCLRWLAGDPPNLDRARESVARIIKEADRAGEIIKRIRALTKKTAPQKTTLDVNEVIGEVIDLVAADLARNAVALRTELAPEIPVVFGDRVQLQQVILNLIANGIEAMTAVTERPRELSIDSRAIQEDGVLVSVCDCGTGFGPESADHLFEAFFTTKQQGIGLGLSISRTIVAEHGGRLWATPNSGPGATFQFTLPKVARASA